MDGPIVVYQKRRSPRGNGGDVKITGQATESELSTPSPMADVTPARRGSPLNTYCNAARGLHFVIGGDLDGEALTFAEFEIVENMLLEGEAPERVRAVLEAMRREERRREHEEQLEREWARALRHKSRSDARRALRHRRMRLVLVLHRAGSRAPRAAQRVSRFARAPLDSGGADGPPPPLPSALAQRLRATEVHHG